MNHFWKVSQPCLTTRGFTALRCPFGDTLSLVRHGLASFGLQTFLRTKTVNKKVSTFKGALTKALAGYGMQSHCLLLHLESCAWGLWERVRRGGERWRRPWWRCLRGVQLRPSLPPSWPSPRRRLHQWPWLVPTFRAWQGCAA